MNAQDSAHVTEIDRNLRDQIDALLREYEASCNPAPYTSERALYERLRGLVPPFVCPEHGLPMVLDTFSGEGGVTRGLTAAGYCVTAVDNDPNRLHYNPAQHKVCGDAIAFILTEGHRFLWIWASPTCTGYSRGTAAVLDRVAKYDRLIAATREALIAVGRPWVIENVEDAAHLGELRPDLVLCGRMFDLHADDEDGVRLVLDRHRVFESTFDIPAPWHPTHGDEDVAGIYGGGRRATNKKPGTPDERRRPGESLASVAPRDRYAAKHVRKGGYVPRSKAVCERLLGLDGMTVKGLQLSIPPVYAEHIGLAFLAQHDDQEVAA